jgi:hypothetical protein
MGGACALPLLLTGIVTAGASKQRHHASNWWSRLIETPNSHEYDMPVNRRSHSATMYRQAANEVDGDGSGSNESDVREWMIISGGFTDQDWQTFPVWAFDLTNSRSYLRDQLFNPDSSYDAENDNQDKTVMAQTSPWMDLTGLNIGAASSAEDPVQVEDSDSILYNNGKNKTRAGPQGRVGHLSSIYNDCLYIFGGLTYSLGSFHVENDNDEDDSDTDEKNTMIVWRACGLSELFSENDKQRLLDESDQMTGLLHWERIVPRVDISFPIQPGKRAKASNKDNSNHRAIAANNESNSESTSSAAQVPEPTMLSRGEFQGGHYTTLTHGVSSEDSFIIYGGIHRHHTSVLENGVTGPSENNFAIQGDVWKYDYETETLSLLAPYPPLDWQVRFLN